MHPTEVHSSLVPTPEQVQEHAQFDNLFAEWLRSRAASDDPAPGATADDDLAEDQRRDELVRRIAFARARPLSLIMRKLEVLERVLESRDTNPEIERHEFALIAGVRADLARLNA